MTSSAAVPLAGSGATRHRRWWALPTAVLIVALAGMVSVFVGVADLRPMDFVRGTATEQEWVNLFASRIPRTVAVLLAGAALALSGMLMQLLVRNKFVEPGTVGTSESASAGLLAVTLLWPGSPLSVKMLVAVVFALFGTALFLRLVRSLPPTSSLIAVPLVGMMLAGMVSAATTFVAFRLDLLQSLGTWMAGDFSGILRGRYELLWLIGIVFVLVLAFADRFTVASLGEEHSTSLGLNHRQWLRIGLALISVASAVTLVVVGSIAFVGLIIPNLVSMALGDNLRRSLPWVAVAGSGFVMMCDLLSRTINPPYEIPVGTVAGVLGAGIFLVMLWRRNPGASR